MSEQTYHEKLLTLRAFHNDPKIKEKYLSRLKLHRQHDELIHGVYWENGKGCAIGCTLHSNKHKDFETKLGLPEWFAYLFELLFERLKNGDAKDFPIEALQAIPVGANLEKTYRKFCIFLLTEICKYDEEKYTQVKKVIEDVITLHTRILQGENVADEEWLAALSAARSALSAAESARSAAESALSAAESARSAAWSAADSAAWSAADSAADSAVESAVWSAAESAADSAVESAVWSAAIKKIADKLIVLLKEAS